MPDNTPEAKRAAVRRYGGEITYCAATLAARESAARELVARTGAAFVHPYDNLMVMAGQGTVAAELLDAGPGPGRASCARWAAAACSSGSAVAAKTLQARRSACIGVEPAGADDAARSLHAGTLQPSVHPHTIADGLRGALAARTFAEIQAPGR